jgi:hypothetical protein
VSRHQRSDKAYHEEVGMNHDESTEAQTLTHLLFFVITVLFDLEDVINELDGHSLMYCTHST